jgi:copper chaperone CopZ
LKACRAGIVLKQSEAVGALPGVANVAVDLATKSVVVEYDPNEVDMDKIKAEIG